MVDWEKKKKREGGGDGEGGWLGKLSFYTMTNELIFINYPMCTQKCGSVIGKFQNKRKIWAT